MTTEISAAVEDMVYCPALFPRPEADVVVRYYKALKLLPVILALSMVLGGGPLRAEEGAGETWGKLVYFTSAFCIYCKTFDREVGAVYPRTAMAKALPMVKVDTFDPPEEYEDLVSEVRLTPTFMILDRDGFEVERLRGYRGEEFWWADMEALLEKIKAEAEQ